MKTTTAVAMIAVVAVAGAQGAMKPMKPMKVRPMMKVTSPRTNWKAMYKTAEKMFEKRDASAITSFMTPDFTMTSMGQTSDLAKAKAGLEQWFGMMKSIKANMDVTKVSENGNMAMVTDHFTMSGLTKPTAKDKKSHRMVDMGTETATWVRMNGKWMMKKLVSTNEKMTMDGKPFKPGM